MIEVKIGNADVDINKHKYIKHSQKDSGIKEQACIDQGYKDERIDKFAEKMNRLPFICQIEIINCNLQRIEKQKQKKNNENRKAYLIVSHRIITSLLLLAIIYIYHILLYYQSRDSVIQALFKTSIHNVPLIVYMLS